MEPQSAFLHDLSTQHAPLSAPSSVKPSRLQLRRAHTVTQGPGGGPIAQTILRRNLESSRTPPAAVKDTSPEIGGAGAAAAAGAPVAPPHPGDSHELLLKQSLSPKRSLTQRGQRDAPQSGLASGREANHFTVGSVGQNGRIFLRPIRNPSIKEPSFPSLSSPSEDPSQNVLLHPSHSSQNHGLVGNDDPARWSNSQLSELRPDLIHHEALADDGDSVFTGSARSEYHPRQNRQRPHSFSTISEHPSTSSIRPRGDYHRVVIDQSNGRQSKNLAEEQPPVNPTLEVPIPHYRLGTPLFTSTGSPALLSSACTQASTRGNSRASHRIGDSVSASPLPAIYLSDSLIPDRPSHISSILSGGAIELGPRPARSEMSVFYEATEPIEPSVFEGLASDMDDESVVRYMPGTKDICAASPARIVAQISSESFMDYELVSDFFLTFRSYLSSNHLLALLLARLQWAINRWQDDGRIIRIRTFAALRHWILNYFVDDFLPDYDLRAYFCETINAMYNDVKAREGGGTSDLKILIDLKRCWHGRCAMCWDASELSSAYYHPDSLIIPGDVNNDNKNNDRTNEDVDGAQQPTAVQTDQSLNVGDNESYLADVGGDAGQAANLVGHYRNHSAATARSIPASIQSDHSFYVTSCSLPPKSPKRLSITVPSGKAPHPVPLLPKKSFRASPVPPKSSPVASKRHPYYGHAHKRSGSFSDSVRDDPAYSLPGDQRGVNSSQEFLDPGSLIRGSLYPPAESYMTMMAPPSPPLPLSPATGPALERQSTVDGPPKSGPSNSGVKTIIGSIRRAFNGAKQGVQGSSSSRHTRGLSGPPLRGKTSMLPNNVAFGSGLYRDRKTTVVAKRPKRVDVLCEKVLKQYRQAIAEQEEGARGEPLPQQQATATPRLEVPIPRAGSRAESELTVGSESIVIVDDTGLDIPMVSGENGEPVVNIEQAPGLLSPNPEDNQPSTPKTNSLRVPSYNDMPTRARLDDEYSMQIFYDDSGSGPSRQPSGTFYDSDSTTSQRSLFGERRPSYRQRMSSSLRLRKYASFQSGMSRISRRHQAKGSEPVPLLVDPTLLREDPEKQHVGPVLRRRPGGDLRKMQNGKSQLSYLASRSSFSVLDSEAMTSRDVVSRPQTSLIPPNPRFSLMQTNSSQDVRRSFEATIAKFAQIPDDSDGGVESTLLKLEGKWRCPSGGGYSYRADELSTGRGRDEPGWLQQRRNVPILAHDASQRRQTYLGDQVMYSQGRGRMLPLRPYSDSVAGSEESFSSIPLLERGLSDESMKKPVLSHVAADPATPRARLSNVSSSQNDTSSDWDSPHPSLDVVRETESMRRIPRGSTLPVPRTRTGRLSQLSSEVPVVDILHRGDEVADGRPSIDSASLGRSSYGIPRHPLAQPPSPPMTIQNPRSVTSCATPLNPVLAQARPLTPDPSPSRRNAGPGPGRSIDIQQDVLSRSELGQQQQQQHQKPDPVNDVDHVPFILACESQLLAQQLTLVEMAALSEIDWRDLVEMRWSSGAPSIRSWVQFLTSEDHRGIDLVVGRFNLMVKWVLSEIVLTQDIHERVQTISKLIHTAVHAKRLCNYATMLQIAIALSSTDCSRLEQTWALVSAEDRRLMKDMEGLIQPVRNFHDLRVEMETANLQEGCIPFVGLYVHDLTYNAQKPAQITTRAGEPLINFERHRTTARIVKNLLRLIDASTKYTFQPVQGVIERCLWIASLSEEEIQARSRGLD